jgi:uncharacterized membrane protein (UPF0182 family)
MRSPSDLPRPERGARRLGDRGRVVIISIAVVVVVLLVSARFLSGFYVDYLWHISVGRGDVFWGVLGSKALLFGLFGAVFIAVAVLNLIIADRLAPATFSANMHPVVERFHEVFGRRLRLVRFAAAVFFGLLFALPATSYWQDWLLFRNSKSFGITDAQFGNDIGFYVFRLPFITFALDWFYAALVFVTLLVLLTHILNGGVVLQPPRPKVRRATKAHLAVLLALLAVVKAADYWVTRYELTTEQRGFVQGATYSVVNAQLPAVVLLALIALLVAGLFLFSLKTDSWRLPLAASGLWVVVALLGGVVYPAVVQALVVNPNQQEREAPFIERNVLATRQAFGIDNVSEQTISFGTLSAAEITADASPLRDVRLLNPGRLVDRFRIDQGQRSGLTIRDLDVDRYVVDGREQQVLMAARELDQGNIATKSWQGTHLIFTHGCGLVQASASRVETSGRPDYVSVPLDRPELYFSESLSGYAVVNTTVSEDVCPDQTNAGEYQGDGGVKLSSFVRRVAFALHFLDYNLLGSSAITDASQLLTIRDVRERVSTVAPFLSLEGDPYPVAVDGRVKWLVDAYTTSNRYPYAQNADLSQLTAASGLGFPFNYIRNSVKATVDAYDGSVALYISDPSDPIVQAWASAFPDLFTPMDAMPGDLRSHLRYPEDLFRVQTAHYSKYRLAPSAFYGRDGAWSVAQGPSIQPRLIESGTAPLATGTDTGAVSTAADAFASEAGTARFVPYYSMFRAPGQTEASFQLLRPFVPFSTNDNRTELQAFMVASSEPETYGQLSAYLVQGEVDGPATVAATIESDPAISQQITLLDQRGSSVYYGDLQLVPLGDGLLYVRPLYVESDTSKQVSYRFVLVSYQGKAAFGTSLQQALGKLFPGFATDLGDVVGGTTEPTDPTDPVQPTDPSTSQDPAELLAQADELFAQADAALPDFAKYAELNAQARALVKQALDLLAQG